MKTLAGRRCLSLLVLAFFETSYVHAEVAAPTAPAAPAAPRPSDEMHVPYVPYVVVDKNKDEFDYDRLQDEILGYLNRRYSEASTTLYDFLRTSHSPTATPPAAVADVRSISVLSPSAAAASSSSSSSSSYFTVGYPANPAHAPSSAGTATQLLHSAYPVYPASIYKSVRKENPLVTARVKVTTYQPHRYSTPLDNPPRPYAQHLPARSNAPATHLHQLPFVPVRQNGFTPILVATPAAAATATPDSILYLTTAAPVNVLRPTTKFPYGSEMKCSLRSSRHVYDGDCVSRKPVVETVCADRCIRYEYKKSKKPAFFSDDSKTNSPTSSETKKQVVALSCSDGDVKKEKVKLYCKDGTIINNIIRIVQNCVCNEHSEKVHATKRNQKMPNEVKAKMAYSMSHPRIIRPRPKF